MRFPALSLRSLGLFVFTLVAVISSAKSFMDGFVTPQVFYEGQPLIEVGPQSPIQLKSYAEMSVGFVLNKDVKWNGTWAALKQKSVYEEYNLCPGQGIKNNPTPFFCSGVFISPQHILTASHCLEDLKCKDILFVRNAQSGKVIQGVPRTDIFTCKNKHVISQDRDLAIIETNQTYSGPLTQVHNNSTPMQGFIFMLGYPLGMPLYWSKGVIIQAHKNFLMSEISAFEGNSGSPVFSQADGRLLGVLVEGEDDLSDQRNSRCRQVIRCRRGQCEGEKISLIKEKDLH